LPQIIIWERRPARTRRSFFDVIFGEVSDPGLLRQLWLFALNYKSAVVKVGDPVDLRAHAAQASDDEERAQQVRDELAGYLEREFRVVLGPVAKEPYQIRDEILSDQTLRDQLLVLARNTGEEPDALTKRARSIIGQISAKLDFRIIEILDWIMGRIFERIFDGIEFREDEFAKLRDAARKGPLLLLPSHKSHIDYLLVSWLFHRQELVPPHIAAGDNLSFWPLGALFRRSGAFFLRRSFKGDPLYASVFTAYVRRLVRDGHNIEFFIEGGRSRSGKLLEPKLGLLGMVVNAFLDGTGRDIQVAPISIVYERVPEDKAYQQELLGGAKKAESVGQVLKASKVLGSTYGRIYLHFDHTLSLGDFLAGYQLFPKEKETDPDPPEDKVRGAVRELAYRITQGINQATVVTPSALVATVLLTHPRRGIAREELEDRCAFLIEFLHRRGARFSKALAQGPRSPETQEGLQQAIFLFHKNGFVTIHDQGDLVVYSVNPDWRPSLDYYKNGLLHHLIEPALVSTVLLRHGGSRSYEALSQEVKTLSRLFKHEFLFRTDISFEETLRQATSVLVSEKLITGDEQQGFRASPKGTPWLSFFRGLVLNFFESALTVTLALEDLAARPLPEKEFLKLVRNRGERLYLTGEIRRREAALALNYQNALASLRSRSVVQQEDAKGKPLLSLSEPYRAPSARQALLDELSAYLQSHE
jgi:glycerol-3-phosphate O-acyltransferase